MYYWIFNFPTTSKTMAPIEDNQKTIFNSVNVFEFRGVTNALLLSFFFSRNSFPLLTANIRTVTLDEYFIAPHLPSPRAISLLKEDIKLLPILQVSHPLLILRIMWHGNQGHLLIRCRSLTCVTPCFTWTNYFLRGLLRLCLRTATTLGRFGLLLDPFLASAIIQHLPFLGSGPVYGHHIPKGRKGYSQGVTLFANCLKLPCHVVNANHVFYTSHLQFLLVMAYMYLMIRFRCYCFRCVDV